MMRYWWIFLMLGCQTSGGGGLGFTLPQVGLSPEQAADPAIAALEPFRWAGGLCLMSGAVLLFISRGVKGWIPLLTGIGLIVLNVLLAEALTYLWTLVLIIGTVGVATLVFGINLKDLKLCSIRSLMFLPPCSSCPGPSSPECGLDDPSSSGSKPKS
tara:strand:+ start:4607 stop:5077 length:471 start_codon:yes stop_codon:yes gene_type:complete